VDLFTIKFFPVLSATCVIVLAVREYVTFKSNLFLKYIFTPLVTALIIGFVILSILDGGASPYRVVILAALISSLVADTMLMVVEVDLMRQGIIFFMLAHILYIAAFSLSYVYRPWNLIVAGVLVVLLAFFYRGVRGPAGAMRIPILVYAAVLCAMLFVALAMCGPDMTRSEGFVVVGAVLFVISDVLLAYLTFIRPHRFESVIVWAVYAPGQLLIALSCFA
jgi:alkylglycerol monooxygenase